MFTVVAEDIVKSYSRKVSALKGVSLSVDKGELFGLIGPDGAGKTTLFRILTTLLLPDSGTASVCGYDIVKDYKEIRKRVGYMPGKFSLYQDLSVRENINFFATLFGTTLKDNYETVKDIYSQIEPFEKRKAGALSGGMKQKLALSCALIHRPDVLFLDEPTTGVDPVSRKEFWAMLKRLKEQGLSIIVSTPYMDEATLCDRIALIHNGSFMDTDSPSGIISKFDRTLLSVKGSRMPSLLKVLRADERVHSCFAFGDTHHMVMNRSVSADVTESLHSSLVARGFDDVEIKAIAPNIEDCYMYLDAINR